MRTFLTHSFPLLLTSSNDSSFAGFFDESLVALSGVDVGADVADDEDVDDDGTDDEGCVCDIRYNMMTTSSLFREAQDEEMELKVKKGA